MSSGPSLWILCQSQGLLPPSTRECLTCQQADLLQGPRVCPEAGSLQSHSGEGMCQPTL